MNIIAQPSNGIVIKSKQTIGTVTCLTTDCADYDAWRALPQTIVFQGEQFGKTGWNSDKGYACYQSDAYMAFEP